MSMALFFLVTLKKRDLLIIVPYLCRGLRDALSPIALPLSRTTIHADWYLLVF